MLVTLVLVSGVAIGQETEEKTLLRTEQMAARLGLDEAQKAKLDAQLKAAKVEREAHMAKVKAYC